MSRNEPCHGRPGFETVSSDCAVKELRPGTGSFFLPITRARKASNWRPIPTPALAFYWIELDRQIRISGRVEKNPARRIVTYFHRVRPGASLSACGPRVKARWSTVGAFWTRAWQK